MSVIKINYGSVAMEGQPAVAIASLPAARIVSDLTTFITSCWLNDNPVNMAEAIEQEWIFQLDGIDRHDIALHWPAALNAAKFIFRLTGTTIPAGADA